MDAEILAALRPLTEREQAILEGAAQAETLFHRDADDSGVMRMERLQDAERMISMSRHTRFLACPRHRHDYVELVYMAQGQSTHLVGGRELTLSAGELLLIGLNTDQEILPCGEEDLMVNFVIRPDYFSTVLPWLMEGEETPLRSFFLRCLRGSSRQNEYMHFAVADVPSVQNLMENLLRAMLFGAPSRRKLIQLTTCLVFLELMNRTGTVSSNPENEFLLRVLRYVEERYADGSLKELAEREKTDEAQLSRRIRGVTGRTFTELMREKRLQQAAWLLRHTKNSVETVAAAVGYENLSFFRRLFFKRFGNTPAEFRAGIQRGAGAGQ